MTRIETDPEALVAMGRELKRASSSIEEAIRKVRSTLNATKWNDPVRRELEQPRSNRPNGEANRQRQQRQPTHAQPQSR